MLFYPLILAHIVGDFIAQPSWLVRLKERAHIGILMHVSIVTMLSLLFTAILTAVYGKPGYLPSLAAAAIVFVTHYLIDLTKVRAPKPPRARLLALTLDQAAHIIVAAATQGYFSILFKTPSQELVALGNVEAWLNLTAFFLYATFAGSIFVFEAGNTILGSIGRLDHHARLIGILDRAAVCLLILVGSGFFGFWSLLAAPAYAAVRLLPGFHRLDRRSWTENAISYAFAAAFGALMVPLRRW